MPEISCGHCGASHPSVAEVRACALDHPDDGHHDNDRHDDDHRGEVPPGDPFEAPGLPRQAPAQRTTVTGAPIQPAIRPEARVGAGPEALGRSLVIDATDGRSTDPAAPPEPWASLPIHEITEATLAAPSDLADTLMAKWAARERFVVRLAADFRSAPVVALDDDAWELGPEVDLALDRLFFAVWANSVELCADGGLASPIADLALALGAQLHDGNTGDIVCPDGSIAHLDGGPVDVHLARSMPDGIVHAVSLEHRMCRPLGDAAPSADLAPDQLAAVDHRGGPARIIAPAGSGKTRVLTERARHLLRDVGVPADAVTLVAFNKRAQQEMLERTPDLEGLRVRTLNALSLAIVNGTDRFAAPAGRRQRVSTIGERDVRNLLRRFVDVPRKTNTDPMAAWIEALTATRLGLKDPAEVERDFGGDVDGLPDVLDRYRNALHRQNLVDFDEQILAAIEVLLTDPHARARAQSTCRLLLVDEFQDLTPAHLMLVRLLAGPRGDVFAVGDDDQTIYGFTGASPEWLVEYDGWFPGALSHALEVNYRCAPAVVDGAKTLLKRNRVRVAKTIRAAPGRDLDDNALQLVTTPDPLAAASERLADLIGAGVPPTDIAVLARVNVALAAPQVAMVSAGLPATGVITPDLLQRTGVRALMAWLRIANDPGSITPADISETVRRPSRALSRRVQEWMGEHSSVRELRRLARRLGDRDQAKIDEYLDDIDLLADQVAVGASTDELVRYVGDEIGLGGALGSLDGARRAVDRSTHLDDLDALTQLGTLQPDPRLFEGWLREALAEPGVPSGEGVLLSTVHRVKGQEWPHVIVVGANQGTFPHRLADREEERRVFHVAITRSSDTTTVIADAGRPSQFLPETDGTAPPPVTSSGADAAAQRRAERRAERREVTPIGPRPDDGLVAALKAWRLERSRTEGMPAYIVFSDATLNEIAAVRPSNPRELSRVNGIGPKKLSDYGDAVLEIVALADGVTAEP